MKNEVLLVLFLAVNCINAQEIKNCSTCSKQLLKIEQIQNLGVEELQFLINDLYARKGYAFLKPEVYYYFEDQEWYKPIGNNDKLKFDKTEQQNIDFLQKKIDVLKSERNQLLTEINNFKIACLNDDERILKTNFDFSEDIFVEDDSYNYLKDILKNIKIENLGWSKNTALYSLTVDNIECTKNYKIKIEDEKVFMFYDFVLGSKEENSIIYQSKNYVKFNYVWRFEWKNNKLQFIDMEVSN
ncbi:YARHG domain-containing protein [Paenimyroides tangerinum]|uniref:YARHG domain-containing protein n=1 Tax=Paenimyroides tangerinum TaxID=2488728 RepID=A0A3P3W7V9_9FLAO|nr:YARHG domain-containing protein [Paenimyroides tangerinum]RRJ91251.1 YARHG domain-containing protein [Paenimyroides tangerinum]